MTGGKTDKKGMAVWVPIGISFLALLVSVFSLFVGIEQKNIAARATDITEAQKVLAERQLDIDKMPKLVLWTDTEDVYEGDTYTKQTIVIENEGEYISEGQLKIYMFYDYLVTTPHTSYKFGIIMPNQFLKQEYTGNFDRLAARPYDTKNKCFTIQYETRKSYELNQFEGLDKTGHNIREYLKGVKNQGSPLHCVQNQSIYFSISYLDIERQAHQYWYRYDPEECTWLAAKTYEPNMREPRITEYADFLEYLNVHDMYIARCLGYNDSQIVELLDLDASYIQLAEDKFIRDLKKFFR